MPIEGDFYEDDEPLDEILADWERSPKGLTGPPERGLPRGINVDLGFEAFGVGLVTFAGAVGASVNTVGVGRATRDELVVAQPISA